MPILHIDMDNTICDYSNPFKYHRKLQPEIEFPQSKEGFFLKLEPLPGAIEAVNLLRNKFEVYILTAPSYKNPLCYTEKRLWIEKWFDLEFSKNLIICHNKALVKGDFLIDDIIHNGFEGEHIHYGTEKFPNWEKVLEYINI